MNPDVRLALEIIGGLVIAILIILKYLLPKNNPGPNTKSVTCKPGHGEMCGDHDRAIENLRTAYGFLREAIPKLEKKVEDNFKEIFTILRSQK